MLKGSSPSSRSPYVKSILLLFTVTLLPEHLSDLALDFLEANTLVSSFGVEADPRAAKSGHAPGLPWLVR